DEMEKILIKDNKRLKDIIADEKKLKKEIENLKKNENKSTKELSLQGRLEFLRNNRQKARKHKEIIENSQNPQTQANDGKQNNTSGDDFLDDEKSDITTQDKPNNKNINSKDIGDAGEYAASMLFTKRSTRYLSNRRKLDANF
ncbi:TPA: hypothetical protein RTH45_001767, partial [Campylobacter jejuni]|nr:hypothetical protein [Campylobacter jejuni]